MYREIVPNQRIVFTGIDHPAGKVEVLTTVTFVKDNGKTLQTVRQTKPLAMPEAAKGQTEGWSGSLDKLDAMPRTGHAQCPADLGCWMGNLSRGG